MPPRARIWLLTSAVILLNVLGNFVLSLGLKQAETLGSSPLDYVKIMFNPGVLAGVSLLVCWMLSRMALLSWADLSFVLPVTSLGYVLSVAAGVVLLGERVTSARWTGTLMIVAGTALVGLTSPRTTHKKIAR
jgi:uncharacterized membrane protein